MEIKRKFLVKEMLDLSDKKPVRYERHYLKSEDGVEERVQKKEDVFEYEIKKRISDLERTKDKKIITEEEFDALRENASEAIIRDSYKLDENSSIKIYKGRFEGLIRFEIEFDSKEEAEKYIPAEWLGEEITHSPLGRDSELLKLTESEFKELL